MSLAPRAAPIKEAILANVTNRARKALRTVTPNVSYVESAILNRYAMPGCDLGAEVRESNLCVYSAS
jgi:hypothetical protein